MALYKRIIVPLDGSKLAQGALSEAREMARLTGAELHLIRVIDYSSRDRFGDFGMLYEYEAMAKALEEEHLIAEAYLADLAKTLSAEGHTVSTEVIDGIAGKAIVRFAEPGDLIVMATHGRTGLGKVILGSVASDVLPKAPCPVLVIPPMKRGGGK